MQRVFRHALLLSVLVFAGCPGTSHAADPVRDAIHYPADPQSEGTVLDTYRANSMRLFPDDKFDGYVTPPPLNSSMETRADLDALLVMQAKERTPEQLNLIYLEAPYEGPFRTLTRDKLFDFEKHPATSALLAAVDHEVVYYVMHYKHLIQRARPTQLEPKLTLVVPIPGNSSYPGGHAAQSYSMALVLGMLDPAHKDAYVQRSIEGSHRREIAGLHYPMDAVAGRRLAAAVVDAMLAHPDVKPLYEAAKREYAAQ
jgi:membrane-associated phospholipid phosphatase